MIHTESGAPHKQSSDSGASTMLITARAPGEAHQDHHIMVTVLIDKLPDDSSLDMVET